MGQILTIEDDENTIAIMKRVLEPEHSVEACGNLQLAQQLLESKQFHIILLDVQLPDGNGFEFLSSLKLVPHLNSIPVLFITGKASVTDQILGFSLGAEDYLIKPIHPLVLRARVNAKLKKFSHQKIENEVLEHGELKFDILKQKLYLMKDSQELEISLTPTEFKLLLHLARNSKEVLSRKHLISAIWGNDIHVFRRTVDTHISHIRTKLKLSPYTIESIPSLGYRLVRIP